MNGGNSYAAIISGNFQSLKISIKNALNQNCHKSAIIYATLKIVSSERCLIFHLWYILRSLKIFVDFVLNNLVIIRTGVLIPLLLGIQVSELCVAVCF